MQKQLELLITLHDLDLMIAEISETGQEVADFGFEVPHIEELKQSRVDLVGGIEPTILRRYEGLRKRYGRPVVAVTRGVCHGCFTALPTNRANMSNTQVRQCENCGRFLYWLS